MFLSRTITAPTLARRQVERSATSRVMVMKYWSQVGRSLMTASLHDPDGLGDERDEEQHEAEHGAELTSYAERLRVVHCRWVTGEQHGGGDRTPHDPEGGAHDRQPDQHGEQEHRNQHRA